LGALHTGLTGDTMIKQLVAATVALSTLTLSAAYAADLPLPVKALPPPVPVWTWTGCYVGIEAGAATGRDTITANTGALTGRLVANPSATDGLVGGTIGCNYQFSRYFVIGIEDDLSWNGLHGAATDQRPFNTAFSHSFSNNWIDTLRGRAGIATWDHALLYATGGAAFAGIQNSVAGPGGIGASSTTNVTGWTVGGGVEFMPIENLSIKVEYLFVQFPTIGNAFNTSPPVGTFTGVNARLSENILRVGFNWRFNSWLPIAGGI
jgi:outer membrane immunogenic protein